MRIVLVCLIAFATCATARAEGWRVDRIYAPARVTAIDTVNGQVRVMAGGLWYAIKREDGKITLDFIDAPAPAKLPQGALPDGQVATGQHDIARAWLAEPTDRYDHGVLGDKIEAGALVIETRDGNCRPCGSRTTPYSRISSRASPTSTATATTRSSW